MRCLRLAHRLLSDAVVTPAFEQVEAVSATLEDVRPTLNSRLHGPNVSGCQARMHDGEQMTEVLASGIIFALVSQHYERLKARF
jgi:hypothetical protein